MDNQWCCQNCHKFIGQIHRHHIFGEAKTHQCRQRKRIKHEEPRRLMLMLHIFHGEHCRNQPDGTDEAGKESCQSVRFVNKCQSVRYPPEHEGLHLSAAKIPDQSRFHSHCNKYQDIALLFLLLETNDETKNEGQNHREQQKYRSVHFFHLILSS